MGVSKEVYDAGQKLTLATPSAVADELNKVLNRFFGWPFRVATGYATFANGGFRVTPYYIDRIEDGSGKTLVQADPAVACSECGRVTDPVAATSARAKANARTSVVEHPHREHVRAV